MKYVKGTPKGAFIKQKEMVVAHLPNIKLFSNRDLYLTTRALKHINDKRPEYCEDIFLPRLHKIIGFPDRIYLNLPEKRGDYLFVAYLEYVVVIIVIEERLKGKRLKYNIVSSFAAKRGYLRKYTELWPGGTATPSS